MVVVLDVLEELVEAIAVPVDVAELESVSDGVLDVDGATSCDAGGLLHPAKTIASNRAKNGGNDVIRHPSVNQATG